MTTFLAITFVLLGAFILYMGISILGEKRRRQAQEVQRTLIRTTIHPPDLGERNDRRFYRLMQGVEIHFFYREFGKQKKEMLFVQLVPRIYPLPALQIKSHLKNHRSESVFFEQGHVYLPYRLEEIEKITFE